MRPRPPLVVGVHRGAGTSTVAHALHADDGGLGDGRADILVCAGESHSLLDGLDLPRFGPVPVLALTGATTPPSQARLHELEHRFDGVVLLPFVGRWQGLLEPREEVGLLLAQAPERLQHPVDSYAAALRIVAAAVLRSGQLHRSGPPPVVRAPLRAVGAVPTRAGGPVPAGARPQPGGPAIPGAGTAPVPTYPTGGAPRPVPVSAPRPARLVVLAGRPGSDPAAPALPPATPTYRVLNPVPAVADPAGEPDDETLESWHHALAGRAG